MGTIYNVHYVPDAKHNLFSESAAALKGLKIRTKYDKKTVTYRNELIFTAHLSDGLYVHNFRLKKNGNHALIAAADRKKPTNGKQDDMDITGTELQSTSDGSENKEEKLDEHHKCIEEEPKDADTSSDNNSGSEKEGFNIDQPSIHIKVETDKERTMRAKQATKDEVEKDELKMDEEHSDVGDGESSQEVSDSPDGEITEDSDGSSNVEDESHVSPASKNDNEEDKYIGNTSHSSSDESTINGDLEDREIDQLSPVQNQTSSQSSQQIEVTAKSKEEYGFDLLKIDKYHGKDFSAWKTRIKAVFIALDCDKVLFQEPAAQPEIREARQLRESSAFDVSQQ